MKTYREYLNERENMNQIESSDVSEDLEIHEEEISEETENQEKYQKFFKFMLSKRNVESPAELSEEEKKEFFSEISDNWDEEKHEVKDGELKKEFEEQE